MIFQPKAFTLGAGAGMLIIFGAWVGQPKGPVSSLSSENRHVAILAAQTESSVTAFPSSEPTLRPTAAPTPRPSLESTPAVTATPKPTPTETPTPIPPVDGAQLDQWFTQYAGHYSVDRELLRRIAVCESKLNQMAVNGPYGGLYQFTESSWRSTRIAMSENSESSLRFNAEEAIKTAAFKISVSGTGAWPTCSR